MSSLKKLELLFAEGKITRREFIAQVSALGLMAAVSPMLLSTPAHAAKPKKGGRFRIGLAGAATTDSLDPATLPDITPQMINTQIRNRLVEIDYKSNPIPELAESWESSPDAAKWTFKLRKGVEFHNGKTMDAAGRDRIHQSPPGKRFQIRCQGGCRSPSKRSRRRQSTRWFLSFRKATPTSRMLPVTIT